MTTADHHVDGPLETAQAFFAAFGAGDLEALTALLADDVDWSVAGADAVPWTGSRRGHAGAREFLELLGEHLEPLAFELRRLVADEDTVVALGHFAQRVRATGREFDSDFAMELVVRDGTIARYAVYEDSHAVAHAVAPSRHGGRAELHG